MQAPFVDAAVSVDPQNRANTFISYYTWGAAIGLGLDLTLRQNHGVTLDDYMRALWEAHGKPEIPYTRSDLRDVLADVTGDRGFADGFFDRYIESSEVVDYERLLAPAGLLLRRARPDAAWLGAERLSFENGTIVVESPTLAGSPLYEAGLAQGDTIVAVAGGAPPASATEVAGALEQHRPGDAIEIVFRKRGEERRARVTLAADPALEVVTYETAGLEVTDRIREFRREWLGSKAGR